MTRPAAAAGGDARAVRAEVIAALLLGMQPAEPRYIAMIWLRGARICGRLALSYAEVHATLVLRDCYLEERPVDRWIAQIRTGGRSAVYEVQIKQPGACGTASRAAEPSLRRPA